MLTGTTLDVSMQTKPVLLIFKFQLYNESSKNVKVNSLKIGHSMILMKDSTLKEDKGFSKVKGIYIVFRMYACEGGSLTNNRCPYRCLSAPIFSLSIFCLTVASCSKKNDSSSSPSDKITGKITGIVCKRIFNLLRLY